MPKRPIYWGDSGYFDTDGEGPRWHDGNHIHPKKKHIDQVWRSIVKYRGSDTRNVPWLTGSRSIQPSPISDQEAWRRARSDVNWTAPAAQGAARAAQLKWRRNNLSQYRERAHHNPAAVRRLRGLAFGR